MVVLAVVVVIVVALVVALQLGKSSRLTSIVAWASTGLPESSVISSQLLSDGTYLSICPDPTIKNVEPYGIALRGIYESISNLFIAERNYCHSATELRKILVNGCEKCIPAPNSA